MFFEVNRFLSSKFFFLPLLLLLLVSCQMAPTEILETDSDLESRVFAKIQYGEKVDFKNSVIIDVRSRFEYEMAKLPRSFNAYWKDWDLRDLKNQNREEKVKELQRLLSLQGIDPLTRVVVLGRGLKGAGEEFLVASTLISLGVKKIYFINEINIKQATQSKKLPPLENIPYWHKPSTLVFECNKGKENSKTMESDIIIDSLGENGHLKVSHLFDKNLKVIPQVFPKSLNLKIQSINSFWSYGLALYFMEQGRKPCVL